MAKTALIYGIQHFCIHDGPGIRTDVFFKGCQLRCPWCCNPESMHGYMEIGFKAAKCTQCGACIRKCPAGAISFDRKERIDREMCSLCGQCVRYCPLDCYQIFGRTVTVGELLEEVCKDELFYQKSGGGVTVTGGEPTLQYPFLMEFLKACKERGLDTSMESNGMSDGAVYRDLAPLVDHFLIDLKQTDDRLSERVIGKPGGIAMENIRMLATDCHKKVNIRIPVIPGFNDNLTFMGKVADFAEELLPSGNLQCINLLPYHNLGMGKYTALNRPYPMGETQSLHNENMAPFEALFQGRGLPVEIGG